MVMRNSPDPEKPPVTETPKTETASKPAGPTTNYAASHNAEVQWLLAERQTAVMNEDMERVKEIDAKLAEL